MMIANHPHLEVFARVYSAFVSGDMNALAEHFAEDVVWHTPGHNPLSGTYAGRKATFESFAKELELSGGTYRVDVHDVLANDEHTVALLHAQAEREGKRLDQDYVIVFHIANEKVSEAWELWSDEAALDAFWQ
jgi:ketosteroid isomerase-like protein